MADVPPPNASGIAFDNATHRRVVPQSVRADGSLRRERKVKPGYTPVEDVPRFRSQRVEAKKAQAGAPRGNAVRAALGLEPPPSSSPSSSDTPSSPRLPGHTRLSHSRADSASRWEHDAYSDQPSSSFSSLYAPSPASSPAKKPLDTPGGSPDKAKSPEKSRTPAKGRLPRNHGSPEKERATGKSRLDDKGRLPHTLDSPNKTRPPGKGTAANVQHSLTASPGSAASKYAPAARALESGPSTLSPSPKRAPGDSPAGSHRRQRGRGRHGKHASTGSGSSARLPENALAPAPPSSNKPDSSPLTTHVPLSLSDWADEAVDWADEDEDDLFGSSEFKMPGISGSIHMLPPQTADKDKGKDVGDADGLSQALGKMNVA